MKEKSNNSRDNEHKMYRRYSMLIEWSEEDQAYIVSIPEFPGAKTHGYSYEEAARQGQDLIESWVDANITWGRSIPSPALFHAPDETHSKTVEVQAS